MIIALIVSSGNTGGILNLDILKQNQKIYRTYYNVLKFSCKFNYTSFSKKKKLYKYNYDLRRQKRKGKIKEPRPYLCIFISNEMGISTSNIIV